MCFYFFFSSRRRHTRFKCDWSSDVCSSDLLGDATFEQGVLIGEGRPFLTLVTVTQETDEKRLIQRANDRLKAFPGYIRVRRVVATREPRTVENGQGSPGATARPTRILTRKAFTPSKSRKDNGPTPRT